MENTDHERKTINYVCVNEERNAHEVKDCSYRTNMEPATIRQV